MNRDLDTKCGDDGRKAHERVFFRNPQKMFGKKIGMAVHNFKHNSSQERNRFKIALINQWGYILYPNRGGRELIHDPAWMYT